MLVAALLVSLNPGTAQAAAAVVVPVAAAPPALRVQPVRAVGPFVQPTAAPAVVGVPEALRARTARPVSRAVERVHRKTRPARHTPRRTVVKHKPTVTHARHGQARTVRHKALKPNERVVTSNKAARKAMRPQRGLSAVVAYALAQVGDRYVHGATGPSRWDCSGLTQAAFRRAGIRLPHQSGGQQARAHSVPRSQARPGDLVAGHGHVGIVVGWRHGTLMMVDAGNPRVGVAYRPVYRGLWIERF